MDNNKANNTTKTKNWKPAFYTVWVGQAFSLIGSSLIGFALIWHLTDTTGSAKVLTLAAMMEWLPRVFISPLAGALVDRWNRKFVMIAADSLTAAATAAIIILGWAGLLELWHIYVLMLLRSLGGAFHFPAMLASTSLMVPPEQLSRVQGLNQLMQGIVNIAAPPLGALLVSLMPLHSVLGVDLVTAAAAILSLSVVSIPQPEASMGKDGKPNVWKDMQDGLRYVLGWKGLRNVLALAILINLISAPAHTLLPLLVKKVFSGGAMEVATMQSSWSIGILLGGLLLAAWGGFQRKVLTATLAMFGSGMGMFIVGVAPETAFGVAIAGILLAGLMNVLTNGPAFALLQTVVPAGMQGRVMSLVMSLANAMTPLGLAFAGPLAEFTGVRTWFILASVLLALSGVFALVNADVRTIENGRTHESQQLKTAAKAASDIT